jgi:hypothetical protein
LCCLEERIDSQDFTGWTGGTYKTEELPPTQTPKAYEKPASHSIFLFGVEAAGPQSCRRLPTDKACRKGRMALDKLSNANTRDLQEQLRGLRAVVSGPPLRSYRAIL